jgi:hypothetical protein
MAKRPDLFRLEQEIARSRHELAQSWHAFREQLRSRRRGRRTATIPAHSASKPPRAHKSGLPLAAKLAGAVGLGLVLSRIVARGRLPTR